LSNLPSSRKATSLLKKAGCPPNVIKHCKTVSKLAVNIAKKLKKKGIPVDVELVRIGGLLHDIGRSRTHNIDHAVIGTEIARSFELPETVIMIIERHIGSGITAEEAKLLGLPERNFLPVTLEEKIVSYADKLVSGNHEMPFDEALERFAFELGAAHPAVYRLKQMHREIVSIIGDLP
jgi:uncharacterized protein